MTRGKIPRGAVLFAVVFLVAAGLVPACGGVQPQEPSGASEGAVLLDEACTSCHDLGRVERAQKTREEWAQTYERMMAKGSPAVPVAEDKLDTLIDYLVKNYGPQE